MNIFQLDEDLNSKKISRECNRIGASEVKRFPKGAKGAADPTVLQRFVPLRTLVTGDLDLARDHAESIPFPHCGIIALGNSDRIMWTATEKDYQRIISNFKQQFPVWHQSDFTNSILTVTERDILVQHAEGRMLIDDAYFEYDSPDWRDSLTATLIANTKRDQ